MGNIKLINPFPSMTMLIKMIMILKANEDIEDYAVNERKVLLEKYLTYSKVKFKWDMRKALAKLWHGLSYKVILGGTM